MSKTESLNHGRREYILIYMILIDNEKGKSDVNAMKKNNERIRRKKKKKRKKE